LFGRAIHGETAGQGRLKWTWIFLLNNQIA
jgi:hypothetical protein